LMLCANTARVTLNLNLNKTILKEDEEEGETMHD
jgi:hypothetical protein